jgi:predicted Zn-dependent peptidase
MKISKTTLSNGLRVITVPAKGNPSVTVLVVVETGSNYESKEENGLSHFLEHMCFKGTTLRPHSIDISRELDSIGAENNAFTSNEMTGYYAKADKKHFKKVLDVISDLYLNPVLPKEELEIERGVILQEISMYEDLPQRKVWSVLSQLMYGDTPAGRTILGPAENIKRFTREDFVSYRERHYIAEKTMLIVAGDVSHQEVVKESKKIFAEMPSGKKVVKPRLVEKQKNTGILVHKKKTDQTHMIVGFRTFSAKHKDTSTLNVLATILGAGMSSRLFQLLREEMGACYYVKAQHEELTDHGVFAISTGINASRAEEVLKAILAECKTLSEREVSKEELDKAKEYTLGHLHMSLETSDALAEFCAEQEVSKGSVDSPANIEKATRAVTEKDIKRLAKKLFSNDNLNVAIVGNISDDKGIKKVLSF